MSYHKSLLKLVFLKKVLQNRTQTLIKKVTHTLRRSNQSPFFHLLTGTCYQKGIETVTKHSQQKWVDQ